jgi:hypothetical protein
VSEVRPSPEDGAPEREASFVRRNARPLVLGLVLLGGAAWAVRWIASNRETPSTRKVMQFTVVTIPPKAPERPPPPPPPPVTPPKVQE